MECLFCGTKQSVEWYGYNFDNICNVCRGLNGVQVPHSYGGNDLCLPVGTMTNIQIGWAQQDTLTERYAH